MEFIIKRELLLPALQIVSNVIERRQTLPILSNLLLTIEKNSIFITATDMEVELIVCLQQSLGVNCEITLPARKLLDITRTLPEGADLNFQIKNDKALIRSGRSRFTLATQPAQEYPSVNLSNEIVSFSIPQCEFLLLLENTQFAMAQQDVRYYLNGLLLEINKGKLRAVATDGHRLALNEVNINIDISEGLQVIIPRKGVFELTKLMQKSDDEIQIRVSSNHISITIGNIRFTSKLIDGHFPEYQRVIPNESKNPVVANREQLKQSLTRASILSNEKYRGVKINLQESSLRALTHNPEQEEAEEEIEVNYSGEAMEIGFNVSYLLDTLSIIKTEKVKIEVADANSSCLILPDGNTSSKYVVMPMRL